MTIPDAMSQTSVDVIDPDVPDTATCPACPHPIATHDAIDLRFCRATVDGGKTRGCTCAAK